MSEMIHAGGSISDSSDLYESGGSSHKVSPPPLRLEHPIAFKYVRRGSIFEVAKNDDDRRLWHLGWVTVEIGILVRERNEEE